MRWARQVLLPWLKEGNQLPRGMKDFKAKDVVWGVHNKQKKDVMSYLASSSKCSSRRDRDERWRRGRALLICDVFRRGSCFWFADWLNPRNKLWDKVLVTSSHVIEVWNVEHAAIRYCFSSRKLVIGVTWQDDFQFIYFAPVHAWS